MTTGPLRSANFQFLEAHDALLVALGAQAERYFAEDPSTALLKLRQFGEVLARRAASWPTSNLLSHPGRKAVPRPKRRAPGS